MKFKVGDRVRYRFMDRDTGTIEKRMTGSRRGGLGRRILSLLKSTRSMTAGDYQAKAQ